ncbi:MAG TPA: tetratricopeptide repeat protein [bacterium]
MKKNGFLIIVMISIIFVSCAGQNKLQGLKYSKHNSSQSFHHPRAVEHFIRGCVSELRNDYKTALLDFSESLLFDSSSATIYNKIAENYIRLKKFESAQKLLAAATKRFPDNVDTYRMLAAIYYSNRDFEGAERVYKKIIQLDPTNIESRYSLVTIYLTQGKELECAAEYEKMIELGYGTPEIRINVGNIYIEHKLFNQSEKIFTDFVKEFPDDERSYLAMAKLFIAKGDTSSAVNWYHKGLNNDPEFETCLEELLDLYRFQKNWIDAASLLEQSIARDVSNIQNHLRLGELYYQKGDTVAAVAEFNHVIELFPDDFRAYFSLASLYYQQEDWEPAEINFKKSIDLNKDFPRSWITLGLLYFRTQKLESAEEHFKQAVAALPDDPHINFLLGSVLNQRRKTDEAILHLENCLKLDPNYVDAMSTLAMIYDEKKVYQKSDSLYQAAIKAQPDYPLLMNNYSYSLSVRGIKLNEAIELAKKAVAADSTNGAFLDTLGWIYFKQGDYQNALEYISRAIRYRDTSAEVMEHLGDVYEKLNDLENAHFYWRKALELDANRTEILEKLEKK